jgi:D-arabinitol 2-dehydrogenase
MLAVHTAEYGLSADMQGAVIYLGSDASKYTTGSEMVIDGGYTCL